MGKPVRITHRNQAKRWKKKLLAGDDKRHSNKPRHCDKCLKPRDVEWSYRLQAWLCKPCLVFFRNRE